MCYGKSYIEYYNFCSFCKNYIAIAIAKNTNQSFLLYLSFKTESVFVDNNISKKKT